MRGIFSNKHQFEGLQDLTEEPMGDEDTEQFDHKMDEHEEKAWKEFSLDENIKMGSHALLLWTFFNIASRSCVYLNAPDCYTDQMGTTTLVLTRTLEYSFLILSSVPLYLCLSQPRAVMYLPVVCLHFVYLLVMNLPPYTYSCDELLDLQHCDADRNDYRDLIADHRDCTLQGHTAQQMCMTWLLITPRIIPRLWMMNLPWVWIFLCYFGVSIWYITRNVDGKATSVADKPGAWFGSRYFSDFDIIASLVLLSITQGIACQKKFYLEKSQKTKYRDDIKKRKASEKMFGILHFMVPVHVIGRMLLNKPVADPVEKVSILFIMICDFDQFTKRYSPEKLLEFLNSQFTAMDHICTDHEVTKIETVGEEYVAAVGVLPHDIEECEKNGHAGILGRLVKAALDIMRLEQDGGEEVQFKMGIHTGPIVAGVIGQKLPRFRLFGDTINTSARMMQKGLPGEIQFGMETKQELPQWVNVKSRGKVEMKGKGQIDAFLVVDDDKIKQAEKAKGGVHFKENVRQSTSTSSFSTKARARKSVVSALVTAHSEANAEVDQMRRQMAYEAGASRHGSVTSAGGNRHGSVTASGSMIKQEVEMAPVPKSGDNAMRAPLLEVEEEKRASISGLSTATEEVGSEMSIKKARSDSEGMRSARSLKSVGSRKTRVDRLETTIEEDTAEQKLKRKQFLEVVQEMESAALENSERKGWFSKFFHDQKRFTEGFTKEMEQDWMAWYHRTTIVKKISQRLDKQALFLSVLTTFDTLYMVASKTPTQDHTLYESSYRFPIFLASRSLAFAIVMAWRIVAGSSDWVKSAPYEVQNRLLGSYMAMAALMFISYDAMVVEKTILTPRAARESSIFSLLFVPIYFIVITNFQLLFRPTCWFILLSCALMGLNCLEDMRSLFFSHQGKALFILNSAMNAYLAKEAEQTSRSRFKAQHAMTHTKDRIETILNTLMPTQVVKEIQRAGPNAAPPCHKYEQATIAQSDLCGFTKLAATRQPEEVVKFMDELFGMFDKLTDKYGIYKVETIGDAYIAGQAHPPLTEKNKPISVILFGLDMVKSVHEWSRGMNENVSCRVGIHTGECIGGIVGTEMQRYHLFGDLMTCLEILESTAPEGRVQISPDCKDACQNQIDQYSLPKEVLMFELRPEPHLQTSKGEKHEYDEVGGRTFVVKSYAQLRGLIDV